MFFILTQTLTLKNPLSDLGKICEEGNYDVAFQVAGGASICPDFMLKAMLKQFIYLTLIVKI